MQEVCQTVTMPYKLIEACRLFAAKPPKSNVSKSLFLPTEIVAQIVHYALQDEDDWITLYRTTPRWRQPKFEAEIEGYILRQRRLETVHLASVSTSFLAEVIFDLGQAIEQQQKRVDLLRRSEKMDGRVVNFLVEECEMLDDVAQRLRRIRDRSRANARPRFAQKTRFSDLGRLMRGSWKD